MKLRHATRKEHIIQILRKGILTPADSGVEPNYSQISNPNLIYLSVDEIEPSGSCIPYLSSWGSDFFYIKDDWLKENSDQFRENSWKIYGFAGKFAKRYGIKPFTLNERDDSAPNCIVSTKEIPVEALDFLVIENESQSKIDKIRAVIPKHMRLFLYNGFNVELK